MKRKNLLRTMCACFLSLGMVAEAQTITTFAGNGIAGYSGDGGPAIQAKLDGQYGMSVAVNASGMYIVDYWNQRIRKVDAVTGIITTIAGNGVAGSSGDGGLAINAQFSYPVGVALDVSGNIYIADCANSRIRKIDVITGIITTVAGNGGPSYSGDGGLATDAELNQPTEICFDASGNMYIADCANYRIRKVDAVTGVITTVAGDGTAGYSGDGGLATGAQINYVYGIVPDKLGNLYISDQLNQKIRKVDALTGIITTIAGNGVAGYSGDGGQATDAELYYPKEIIMDSFDNVYIADTWNQTIRKLDTKSGVISTFAGDGIGGYSGDGGPAISAELNGASGVSMDPSGSIYIADCANNRVRKVECLSVVYNKIVSSVAHATVVVSADTVITTVIDTIANDVITTVDTLFITNHIDTETTTRDSTIFTTHQCANVTDSVTYLDTVSISVSRIDTIIHHSVDTVQMITTSVQAGLVLSDISVYPNPFTRQLHIDFGDKRAEISLFDVLGREMQRAVFVGDCIFEPHVPPGIYMLRISAGSSVFQKKIIKE